ncbi:thioredoxin domain-containing protein [Candidatus Saccharibacteria bacterium]|nr:thioredoxin domain-containing protein [Candidatus Saccharibacteria bacterium]
MEDSKFRDIFSLRHIIVGLFGLITIAVMVVAINQTPESSVNPADTIHAASAETGNLPEKIIGDAENAKVIVYEYADYACAHCAEQNQTVKDLVEEYDGKIAVVFRSYDLKLHNGAAAAKAATAAAIQGCWEAYKDLLFANQAEWYYATASGAEALFCDYFETASKGLGDVQKFVKDMYSDEVAKRVAFENEMGDKVKLRGTPLFRIDGDNVVVTKLAEVIEAKIIE